MKVKHYLRELLMLILAFSIVTFLLGLRTLIPCIKAMSYDGETIGVASSVMESGDYHANGTIYTSYVDYSVDGKDYYTSVIWGAHDNPKVGDKFHIVYRTGDPKECYVDSYPNGTLTEQKTKYSVLSILILLSVLGIIILKPKTEEEKR